MKKIDAIGWHEVYILESKFGERGVSLINTVSPGADPHAAAEPAPQKVQGHVRDIDPPARVKCCAK